MNTIALFAAVIIIFGLFSRRLERWAVTPQMAFIAAGFFFSAEILGVIDIHIEQEVFLFICEITLVLTLFTDACRIDMTLLKSIESLPARMLSVGMPLTIAAGTALAALIFTELTFVEAAIIGTILSPTDAGLSQAVVNSPKVPQRIRQALNVESGLNDGIATPILYLFIALAGAEEQSGTAATWAVFALKQIGLGTLVGVAVGLTGGWLVVYAMRHNWMSQAFQWLTLPALALVAWALATRIDGNGFIAAFVGGLTVAWITHGVRKSVVEFSETGGQLLNFGVFMIFGSIVATRMGDFSWDVWFYAILSLTAVRMLPVAISLLRSKLHWPTVVFMGWFGPRGLATIVLGLVVVEESNTNLKFSPISIIAMATVLLSVFAHGLTAKPLIQWYSRHTEALDNQAAEKEEVKQLATRTTSGTTEP